MVKQYKELKQLIDDAKHICFFTGAGMSTESGIPGLSLSKWLILPK